MDMSFIVRPDDVVEGDTIHEIRVSYDEYGIVGIQMAPLDDKEYSTEDTIMVLEAALSVLKADLIIDRPPARVNTAENMVHPSWRPVWCSSSSLSPDGSCSKEFNCAVGIADGIECCCNCPQRQSCIEICTSVTSFPIKE